MKPLAIIPVLLLAACLPPRPAALVDPASGEEVACVSANASSLFSVVPSIAERERRDR